VLTTRLDASVIDERDLFATDPALDIFSAEHAKPFSTEFVARIRAAQLARNRRISAWCEARLREFRDARKKVPVVDQVFPVYRTMADPRFIDAALEPNGRALGTALDADPWAANYGVNATAAVCTLTSWLSQWSIDHSVANGPRCLSRITVPTLLMNFLADEIVYPSDAQEWHRAARSSVQTQDFPDVGHYPQRRPGVVDNIADIITEWVGS
jgi:pimeloyl-ACP methyl ester carboxylesterase